MAKKPSEKPNKPAAKKGWKMPFRKISEEELKSGFKLSTARGELDNALRRYHVFKNLDDEQLRGRISRDELDAFKAAHHEWKEKVNAAEAAWLAIFVEHDRKYGKKRGKNTKKS